MTSPSDSLTINGFYCLWSSVLSSITGIYTLYSDKRRTPPKDNPLKLCPALVQVPDIPLLVAQRSGYKGLSKTGLDQKTIVSWLVRFASDLRCQKKQAGQMIVISKKKWKIGLLVKYSDTLLFHLSRGYYNVPPSRFQKIKLVHFSRFHVNS